MGLEFTDEGYGYTAEPSSANFGKTSGTIGARTGVMRTADGYKARLIDVDLKVHSMIRTTSKQSYDPKWNHKGPDLFQRNPRDVQRTITHEGEHRENNRQWYNEKHDELIKSINGNNKTYKSPEQAAQAVQKTIEGEYHKFSDPDTRHEGPNWKGWQQPGYEHPGTRPPDASRVEERAIQQGAEKAAEKVGDAEHGLNRKPQ
jgi:hypothetical protein